MWRKTLFHHDLSEEATSLVDWAAGRLLAGETTLLLAHIVNPVLGPETPQSVRLAQEELERLAADLLPGVRTEIFVAAGDPLEELPRLARERGCTSALLLLDDADEAALVVPRLALPQLLLWKGRQHDEELFRSVAVALDLSPDRTEPLLAALTEGLGGRTDDLELLHSLSPSDPEAAPDLLLSADAALQEIGTELSGTFGSVRTALLTGDPEETLPDHLDRTRPSLLVLGLSRHGDLWELFLGGTAQRLLRRVTVPVLLLPVDAADPI